MNPFVEKEMEEFVARIQRDYPAVEYYNFFRDERFNPQDFHDALHLSESGSRKFSNIIAKIIANNKWRSSIILTTNLNNSFIIG